MKIAYLIFCLILINVFESNSQVSEYPYNGGESALRKDLINFLSKEFVIDDSSTILFVEVSFNANMKETEIRLPSSSANSPSTLKVSNYFNSIKDKWDKKFLEKMPVIIPIIILTSCSLDKNGDLNWNRFFSSENIGTKLSLFTNPISVRLQCGEGKF